MITSRFSTERATEFVAAAVARALAHGVGVLATVVLTLWIFADTTTRAAFLAALEHPQFRAFAAPDLLFHVGLSVCLWAALCLGVAVIRRQIARGRKLVQVAGSARRAGTVMIETLIALPVLLMLIFGIAQLTINNIAGIFTNLATFQAARSAWLWEGEPCRSIECDPEERARIQAAAVLTPVVPGALLVGSDALSPAADQMRGTLMGTQLPELNINSGEQGMQMATSAISGTRSQTGSLGDAVDVSTFSTRTARKFTFAYHATDIDVFTPGPSVLRVEVTYRHHCAVPLVGYLFGEPDQVAGRSGYYSHIERVFELTRLPEPNREAVVDPNSRRLY
ncbi:MAG: TadE/TadG family type IV pilus assembly protein [Persicimonas sp.]